MTAAGDSLARIRAWVGTSHPVDDIDARWVRLGDENAVALEILRQRRADIVADGPAKWTAQGDYSEDWAVTLAQLDTQIGQLDALVAESPLGSVPDMTAGQLVRDDVERLFGVW